MRRGAILLAPGLHQGVGIQRPVPLLGKVSFMQHQRSTIGVSRVMTVGVLNGDGGICAGANHIRGRPIPRFCLPKEQIIS
jgi:hypothetical protein